MLYNLVRFFPYWAVPLAIVLVDLGIYFRRKKKPSYRWVLFLSAVLVILSLVWVITRGDRNADRWVGKFLGVGQIGRQ